MTVRSRRLLGPVELTGTPTVLYTVPAGRTALCKALRVVNTDAATDHWVSVAVNGVTEADCWLWEAPVGAGKVFGDQVWSVLEAGDALYLWADVPGVLTASWSGAELAG